MELRDARTTRDALSQQILALTKANQELEVAVEGCNKDSATRVESLQAELAELRRLLVSKDEQISSLTVERDGASSGRESLSIEIQQLQSELKVARDEVIRQPQLTTDKIDSAESQTSSGGFFSCFRRKTQVTPKEDRK